MKSLYYTLLTGLVISFFFLVAAAWALLAPVDINSSGTITAVPKDVKAGQLVSYSIDECTEGQYSGVTSVNIQSVDIPPSVTVAVAAPSPQEIHCTNAILIPAVLPTGDYRVLVFISYDVNPVRNTFNPVRSEYRSGVIHVKNPSKSYVLPKLSASSKIPKVTETVMKQTTVTKVNKQKETVTKEPVVKEEPKPPVENPKECFIDLLGVKVGCLGGIL